MSLPVTAAGIATAGAALGLQLVEPVEWVDSWRNLADLYVSLWLLVFAAALVVLWLVAGAVAILAPSPSPSAGVPAAATTGRSSPGRAGLAGWACLLLVICLLELFSHAGERNGFLASSRPTSGVENWTSADGYATLLEGIPAQGDGLFLLSMLKTFLGQGQPGPSEYDRRAGHLFLVSLLQPALGTYWGFAGLNLLCWWGAAVGVWWLGRRRWPASLVPWIASLLVATGQGFIFMGAAPQPHAVAFGAFVLLIVLADVLGLWQRRVGLTAGLQLGWATGAMGLVYFVHLPALLFFWLYALVAGRPHWRAMLLCTAVTLALMLAWQAYASALLGLSFAGGNNDYAGEAVRRWLDLLREGPRSVLGQLHFGSLRGIFVGAFYYPWWALAAIGIVASPGRARSWALVLLVAAALPAIAFTTRFQLPRLAYFMYPAVYLLAAKGIDTLATWLGGRRPAFRVVVAALFVVALAGITNVDLTGWQRFNVWFHYGQGTTW